MEYVVDGRYKVSMDAAGEVIAVGADGEEDYRGAVYVFRHSLSDGDWLPEKTLRLTKRTAEDNFGGSVHVAADGKVRQNDLVLLENDDSLVAMFLCPPS